MNERDTHNTLCSVQILCQSTPRNGPRVTEGTVTQIGLSWGNEEKEGNLLVQPVCASRMFYWRCVNTPLCSGWCVHVRMRTERVIALRSNPKTT